MFSYDVALCFTNNSPSLAASKPGNGDASQYPTDVKVRPSDAPVPAALAMPEPHNGTAVAPVAPTVYYYVNPKTGDRVASLLPPDHPEMICFQEGKHKNETRFGIVGGFEKRRKWRPAF